MPEKRVLISVKIEADAYRLAKTAASWKGVDLAEYLSSIVRPVAKRDCAKIGRPFKEGEDE